MATSYPDITEDDWAEIVAADDHHNYQVYPTETSPPPDLERSSPIDPPSDPSSNDGTNPEYNPEAYSFGVVTGNSD